MLDKKMEEALNDQINAEMFSSYLYLSMSAYFTAENLTGFANWMYVQSQEETFHAMKFFDYIHERGGAVELLAIEKPQAEWDTPLAAFEAALKHEQYITKRINDLVDLAMEIRDHASNNFLQWFIKEQVEEEASAAEIVAKLEMIKDSPNGLFMMDRELGARNFTPPAAE
ncbi:ferritin [bacterium]|nr:ferritin [candidate division CSSED10-310 bacterium]